jgi:carbon-monoxide dehydrogenase iron sulfur subunit
VIFRFELTIEKPFWIMRDYVKCSGCRRCEIACSLHHEGRIWPEASRVRVFMLVPGAEVPHLCAQCEDHPCVGFCPVDALSVDPEMKSIDVDRELCTACGNCVDACPGRIPHLHPTEGYALICDFCGGDPQCVKACHEGRWDCLFMVKRQETHAYRLYAKRPEEVTKELALMIYGEKGKELI